MGLFRLGWSLWTFGQTRTRSGADSLAGSDANTSVSCPGAVVGRSPFQTLGARSTDLVACLPTLLAFVERIDTSCPMARRRSAPTVA